MREMVVDLRRLSREIAETPTGVGKRRPVSGPDRLRRRNMLIGAAAAGAAGVGVAIGPENLWLRRADLGHCRAAAGKP
jgi:hypothetical protein